MLKAETDLTWSVDSPNFTPEKVAFAIRQGIKTAAHLDLSDYASLSGKYVIRTKPGKVIAELRNAISSAASLEDSKKVTVHEANSLESLITQAIKFQDLEELYFPNVFNPNEEMLKNLYTWTFEKGFKIVINERGITLTKRDIGGIGWIPTQSKQPEQHS